MSSRCGDDKIEKLSQYDFNGGDRDDENLQDSLHPICCSGLLLFGGYRQSCDKHSRRLGVFAAADCRMLMRSGRFLQKEVSRFRLIDRKTLLYTVFFVIKSQAAFVGLALLLFCFRKGCARCAPDDPAYPRLQTGGCPCAPAPAAAQGRRRPISFDPGGGAVWIGDKNPSAGEGRKDYASSSSRSARFTSL